MSSSPSAHYEQSELTPTFFFFSQILAQMTADYLNQSPAGLCKNRKYSFPKAKNGVLLLEETLHFRRHKLQISIMLSLPYIHETMLNMHIHKNTYPNTLLLASYNFGSMITFITHYFSCVNSILNILHTLQYLSLQGFCWQIQL